MNKSLLSITLGLTGLAPALTVVNTTPANDQAGLTTAAGQTFTTPVLGAENKLDAVTVRGPQSGATATVYTMKIWQDTDGNVATWDPGALIATSSNSIAISTNNGDHLFTFSGEVLADNTVYVISFNNGTIDHAGFRPGLTNASGVAIANGSLFSSGATPFGNAYDMSFILTTNSGAAPKDVIWTAATNGDWDNATSNWKLPDTSPATFNNGDSVSFDDTAASGSVNVVGSIEPASILVDNDTLAYTLGGGALGGTSVLTKQGPGSLALTSNHGYSGGTTLTAGSIIAGDGATAGQIGGGAVSLAAGTTLTISRSDLLDYKAATKLRILSGDGDLVLNGGGTLFTYPGGGTGFNSATSWAGFTGDITLLNGSEWQSIRNGATGHGTGTIILGDATTSGSLSQIEGNWTWTNNISVVGPDNKIINRSAGPPRTLKLQGTISGDGGLTFEDATVGMTDPNRGFIITNDVILTTPISIPTGVPVRIGGVPGEVSVDGTGLNADSFGSLGTTGVANEGFLTFSRTDVHQVDSAITGEGDVRIGIPSAAGLGDTSTQVVTFGASQSYTGDTIIERGTLFLPTSVTLDSMFVDVAAEGILAGTGTVAGDVDLAGTISPGASVGTLETEGQFWIYDGANYACEISAWSTPTSDVFTADEIQFFTTSGGMTITIAADSLVDFAETNQTFVIATTTSGIFDFDAGDFTIDDSAFSAATGSFGTWAVQQDGNNLELVYTLGTAPDDYAAWIDGFFPGETDLNIIGFDADPDGDGIDNGVENFLGSAPNAFSAGLVPTSATASSLTATHTQTNDPASDVTGSYEWSSDLATWNASGDTDGNGVTATLSTIVTDDQVAPANDTVEVTATITGGPDGKLFLRVAASQPVILVE